MKDMDNKKVKTIERNELIDLHDAICIIDAIAHGDYEFEVTNDEQLTNDLYKLRRAVKLFEKNTGIKIEIG